MCPSAPSGHGPPVVVHDLHPHHIGVHVHAAGRALPGDLLGLRAAVDVEDPALEGPTDGGAGPGMKQLPAGEDQGDPEPRAAALQDRARLAQRGGQAVYCVGRERDELRGDDLGGLEDADPRHPARGTAIGTRVHWRDRVEQGDAMADLQAAAPAGAQLDQHLERGPGAGVVVHPERLAGGPGAGARAPAGPLPSADEEGRRPPRAARPWSPGPGRRAPPPDHDPAAGSRSVTPASRSRAW